MKSLLLTKASLFVALGLLVVAPSSPAAENVTDAIEVVRTTYRADRQAFLAESLELTESQSASFWPLYRAYRTS